MKAYSKEEAREAAIEFIAKVNKLEKEYGLSFNSDEADIYLSYKSKKEGKSWEAVDLGWIGDGTGIKVVEPLRDKSYHKEQALAKLSKEEKEALGI